MVLYIKEFSFILFVVIFIINVKCQSYFDFFSQKCLPGRHLCPDDLSRCCFCPKGTFSPYGISCEKCKAGTYADKEGSIMCYDCPAGTWSNSGASYCYQSTINSKSEASYYN